MQHDFDSNGNLDKSIINQYYLLFHYHNDLYPTVHHHWEFEHWQSLSDFAHLTFN